MGVADVHRLGAALGLVAALASVAARGEARVAGRAAAAPLPVVQGRLFSPGDSALAPMRVFVRTRAGTDSVDALPSGHFTLLLSAPAADGAELLVDAVDPADRRYYPSFVRVASARELQDVRIVLVPRRWTIAAGSYAGQTVDVDVRAALTQTGDDTRFWRLSRLPLRPAPVTVGWPAERLPVPVALQRTRGRITAADSAAFWQIVRELEGDFGMPLFRPVPGGAEGDEDDPGAVGIVVRVDPTIHSAGLTFVTWGAEGDIYDGDVSVRSPALLHDQRVVTHEMLHALGLGHTPSWASVMSNASLRLPRATALDVAHGQVMHQVRWAQRATEAPYGIGEAADGVRAAAAWRPARVATAP
jgi:hypothetical protein